MINMKYIGGEIEYEDNNLAIQKKINYNIKSNYNLYSTGRTALKYILSFLKPTHPILLPSYMCVSICQPFNELGIPFQFYRIKKDLSIDIEFLLNMLNQKKYSALLFINYFGSTQNHNQLRTIKKLYNKLVFIEDCTHSTFIPHLLEVSEYWGDIVFGSLRKTLPVSDGAFIFKTKSYPIKQTKIADDGFSLLKNHGKQLRKLFINGLDNNTIENIYIDLLNIAEARISDKIPDTGISKIANKIINKLNLNRVFQTRQINYNYLFDKLNNDKQIQNVGYCINKINKSEMPYMLPFYVVNKKRNKIRELMRNKGVFVSIIWSKIPEISVDDYIDTHNLGMNILCFPIDQRYNLEDMNNVYLTLKKVINEL